jgi:hypothetical protein
MTLSGAGNVGIGTTTPTARLHVVGDLRVSGAIIYGAPEGDIPDYVFEPDYRLMSLEELQCYLQREKHLPNLPSAAEVREKGLNLASFQMRLLEKIEELTLYALHQAKVIGRKDAELSQMNARLEALEERLGLRRKR